MEVDRPLAQLETSILAHEGHEEREPREDGGGVGVQSENSLSYAKELVDIVLVDVDLSQRQERARVDRVQVQSTPRRLRRPLQRPLSTRVLFASSSRYG